MRTGETCDLGLHSGTLILIPFFCISVVPWFQPGFPSLIQSFAGTDLTIDCRALAGDVTWYKNAISVRSLPNPRMSVSANGSLLIQNASHVDGGFYQAFARTSVDEVCSPPITLDILGWYIVLTMTASLDNRVVFDD